MNTFKTLIMTLVGLIAFSFATPAQAGDHRHHHHHWRHHDRYVVVTGAPYYRTYRRVYYEPAYTYYRPAYSGVTIAFGGHSYPSHRHYYHRW